MEGFLIGLAISIILLLVRAWGYRAGWKDKHTEVMDYLRKGRIRK